LAVVGVGRAGRGDDGAGPALCAELEKQAGSLDGMLILDAGIAPENVGAALRRFGPDAVVLVDAAKMGEPPGAVRRLEEHNILGCSASTHTVPLGLVARYLAESLACEVRLLGIQPAVVGFDGGLSDPVHRSVRSLARHLAAAHRTESPKIRVNKERSR